MTGTVTEIIEYLKLLPANTQVTITVGKPQYKSTDDFRDLPFVPR